LTSATNIIETWELNSLNGTDLSLDTIVAEFKAKRGRINHAIIALEGTSSNGAGSKHATTTVSQKRGMTAAGRKRISEMMKKRWAERHKKAKSKG
jgi:hypothetical protein